MKILAKLRPFTLTKEKQKVKNLVSEKVLSPWRRDFVIKSLLKPSRSLIDISKSVVATYLDDNLQKIIELLKSIDSENRQPFILIGLLRGSLPILWAADVYFKNKKRNIPCFGITVFDDFLKTALEREINKYKIKQVVVVDGWAMSGNYLIKIKSYLDQIREIATNYYSLLNLSNKNWIKAIDVKDNFYFWACLEDYTLGMSSLFVDKNGRAAAFTITPNLGEKIKKILQKKIIKSIAQPGGRISTKRLIFRKTKRRKNLLNTKKYRYGICEVIKSTERGRVEKIFITPSCSYEYRKILDKYCSLFRIKQAKVKTSYPFSCYAQIKK